MMRGLSKRQKKLGWQRKHKSVREQLLLDKIEVHDLVTGK
jgi:hypothetical protein